MVTVYFIIEPNKYLTASGQMWVFVIDDHTSLLQIVNKDFTYNGEIHGNQTVFLLEAFHHRFRECGVYKMVYVVIQSELLFVTENVVILLTA